MEKLIEWLINKTEQKNWVLFTVVLGIVNAIWLRCLTGHWFCFDIGNNHAGFLALEILLTSLAVTRILVAVDIIYWLQIWPISGDLIVLVDRRKRAVVKTLKIMPITEQDIMICVILSDLRADNFLENHDMFSFYNVKRQILRELDGDDNFAFYNRSRYGSYLQVGDRHRLEGHTKPYIMRYYNKLANPKAEWFWRIWWGCVAFNFVLHFICS